MDLFAGGRHHQLRHLIWPEKGKNGKAGERRERREGQAGLGSWREPGSLTVSLPPGASACRPEALREGREGERLSRAASQAAA